MAKHPKRSRKDAKGSRVVGGPFLAAAFFCESIIEDKDKVLSAIRITDAVEVLVSPDAPENTPSEERPLRMVQHMLLVFRSGDAPGKHHLKLVMESPGGNKNTVLEKDVELSDAPNGGIHVKGQVSIDVTKGGLFWTDVLLDGKRYTRMPFKIQLTRLARGKGEGISATV